MDAIRIPSVTFKVHEDGGGAILEHDDGCGETVLIEVHCIQVAYLAELMGICPRRRPMPAAEESEALDGMYHIEVGANTDGIIVVSQTRVRDMGGSDDVIELHPIQARWLAAKLLKMCRGVEHPKVTARVREAGDGQLPLLDGN
ncbi:MAG: hypothetical protein Q8M07_07830 [Prosthecobacter sp.]|nr:hypothetical protein [Prosthecobacter sp.]